MTQRNDTYLGNPLVKRDGIQQAWTEESIKEYARCMQSPVYFAVNYLKVINLDEGLVPFELYGYQEKMFDHFNDNRFSIVLACRQSGKSISSVAYLLWYAVFHSEQTIAILANKGSTAREMLARITLMLENLPFFLQPGCKALNKGSVEFSNNSRIIASATSGSSIRGMSINVLFLDEFAFVENDAEFYTSTYPVISSGKNTKVIITSTRNGIANVFHKLYEGAVQKTNNFKPFRVDWWDVPGRDEAWKAETIANTSQLQFDQEFGNMVTTSGTTLVDADKLLALQSIEPIYTQNGISVYVKPKEDRNYLMFVDVAKGRGQDYSTFNIIDVTEQPFNQVCTYRDNMISPLLYPDVIYKYATTYNDAYVVIENNDAGAVVCNGLYYDLEYENVHVESSIKAGGVGVTMNKKIKRIGCSNIKDLIEQGKLQINDAETIIELSAFSARGSSYEALPGMHDDLVMNLVMFGWYSSTPFFLEMTDIDLRNMLYSERMAEIESDMLPFGIIGHENEDDGPTIDTEFTGDIWTVS
tara:strand:+ start:3382 stop:4965 length:1584 start_codon:yes stop_codon:yes gene_type:complete